MLTIAALFRIAPPPPRLAVTLATERARRSAGSIPRSAADIAEDLVNGDDCLLTAEELRVCFVLSSHCAPQHATFALDSPENTQEKELAYALHMWATASANPKGLNADESQVASTPDYPIQLQYMSRTSW